MSTLKFARDISVVDTQFPPSQAYRNVSATSDWIVQSMRSTVPYSFLQCALSSFFYVLNARKFKVKDSHALLIKEKYRMHVKGMERPINLVLRFFFNGDAELRRVRI